MEIKLQKYDAYKNSGVEWLGEIPEHWEVKKLKYFGFIFPGLTGKKGDDFNKENFEGASEFIPFTTICNYSQIKDERFQYVKILGNEYQNLVEKNDLLFLMSSETQEDIAKSSVYLLGKSAYLNSFCKAFRITNENLNSIYLNYLLNSSTYRKYFELCGRGFTRVNIKQEYINDVSISLPPISEQTATAKFLDDKTEKIDQAIRVKQEQITLLKERRQVLIHQAVTRGLDQTVKLKDSGVAWIGEIPEHWEVKRAKYLFDEIDERSKNGSEELLSVSHMTGVTPRSEKNVSMFMSEDYSGSKLCKSGDLIYNIMWAWMGALGISKQTGIISPSYAVYRQKSAAFNTIYLEELLTTAKYVTHYNRVSTGLHSSRLRFYSNMFFQMPIAFPSKEEQDAIVNFIELCSFKINSSISLKEKEIDKLKEYKASLINSVVTGKVKIEK